MRANILLFILITLLSGCGGGSSGANGSDPFGDSGTAVLALSIQLLDGNCSVEATSNTFTTDENICVQATLTSNGSVVNGEVVSFSLSSAIGTLDDTTALTNSSGIAEVVISNESAATGAATITATYSTASTTANYEYTPAEQTSDTPTLSVEMIVNGNTENRFQVGENVALRATVLDAEGAPIPDEIVTFSVSSTSFTITPADALTDNTGTARATMSATSDALGAHVLTISITLADVTYDETLNIEVVAADNEPGTPELSVAILNSQCQAEDQSFNSNEIICVEATLTRNDVAAANEIITFSLSSTLGSLNTNTALTNENGVATVSISNNTNAIGAASISATYDTLVQSANFEYVSITDTILNAPSIDVEIILTGNRVNGFQAGQDPQVRVSVLDSEQLPVSDAIVTYAIQGSGPVLSPTSALTNASGIAEVGLSATENDLGAYSVQVGTTVNDIQISNSTNFEVRSSGAVIDSETKFGHINDNGEFIEGVIGSSIADANDNVIISAGATTGFEVALVDENDQRIATPTPVSFTSTCVANGQASIDGTVTTINGVASATFEEFSCAGATGNTDQIVASVVVNNSTLTATRDIEISAEEIGSISFVSATPESIVLSGTGGQNNNSVSTLVFQVNGALGNPLAQQEVTFALNTRIGGLTIAPLSGLTNTQGQVSTRVTAGSVPTPVRVTASITVAEGSTIKTQSDLLTVNTGLPDQNSFSIGASVLNVEGADIAGNTSVITVRLADAFNNPVPNGTTVNFTAESGLIDAECLTGANADGTVDPDAADSGTCSVTWESGSPEVEDHRVTILAYAIGHETLFDVNGNNAYDDTDGGPILDGSDSGFEVSGYGDVGFIDHSEAWRDDDEDGIRDESEIFFDFNDNEVFDNADGLFNGPQCNSETLCDSNASSIHIRRSMVLVTSSSNAYYRLYGDLANDTVDTFDDANIFDSNDPNVTINDALTDGLGQYVLADGDTLNVYVVYYDLTGQPLASGTTLGIVDNLGNISQVLDSVNNTIQRETPEVPGNVYRFDSDTSGDRSLAIDSPSGTRTSLSFSIITQ